MKVSITYKDDAKDSVKVSVNYDDLWNGDVTLARVIYPFLKKYRRLYDKKDRFPGCPPQFAADPTKPEGPENCDRFDDWVKCLDKMVYSFEWIAKHHDWDGPEVKNYHKECDKALKPYKKELKKLEQEGFGFAFKRRAQITQRLFKTYHKKFEAHRIKVQDGINLFAKHFGAFWL